MADSWIISALLLTLVLLDAIGDALKDQDKQLASHLMQSLQIGCWFAVWALYGFIWDWILIYIMARVWLFDVVYNLCTGNRILYVGKSDLMGRLVRWFARVADQRYEHFSFMIKVVSFVIWIGWNIKILA